MRPIYLFSTSSHPDAISISSLEITFFKANIDFSNYDYLILTSKQAVNALKQYKQKSYINKEALCISNPTAKQFESLGGKVLDIGAGYGDTLQEKIQQYPKETRWLYLRAETIASDFVKKLQNDAYYIDEAIVYRSECSQQITNISVEPDATLIFTSPSSVKCFLKHNVFSDKSLIIVIGKTTAKSLPQGFPYKIAQESTITSCINLAQNN